MTTVVSIVEPCYHKHGGHHHSVNQRISRELGSVKHAFFVDSQLDTDLALNEFSKSSTFHKVYSSVGYVNPDHYTDYRSFCVLAASFARQSFLVRSKVIIAHTLLHFHLYGLSLALNKLHNKTIIIGIMFSPYEGLRQHPNDKLDFSFTRIALRSLNGVALRNGHRVTLGVSSEFHLSSLYSSIFNECEALHIERAPWLVGYHNLECMPPTPKSSNKKNILLYIGDAKPDKGIYKVLEFLRWLTVNQITMSCNTSIIIRITYCDAWLQDVVEEISSLSLALHNFVDCRVGCLDDDSFYAIIASATTVVWLYDPINYRYRTSGIFYDAVTVMQSTGKRFHFIASCDSWIESECLRLELPLTSVDLSVQWYFILTSLIESSQLNMLPVNVTPTLLAYTCKPWAKWALAVASRYTPNQLTYEMLSSKKPSTLVLSTLYDHFGLLSGPTGLIPFLKAAFHAAIPYQRSSDLEWQNSFLSLRTASSSSNIFELGLLDALPSTVLRILCIDGEHSGAVLALARATSRYLDDIRLFSWFHQPADILGSHIINADLFMKNHVNPICISPCQHTFFTSSLGYNKEDVGLIPHGVHRTLLDIGSRSFNRKASRIASSTRVSSCHFLTVGNWLRDRETLYVACSAFPQHLFTWVSSGLVLTADEKIRLATIPNLEIISTGVSDSQLHLYYERADALLQPLIGATANNAILEAMAFGLPIITSDLESTRWYTGSNALFYSSRDHLFTVLQDFALMTQADRLGIGSLLRSHVQSYEWSLIGSLFESFMAD